LRHFIFKHFKMRTTKLISVILFLIQSIFLNAQDKVWTLEQCINQAYKENIQIKQSQLNNEINELNIEQSKANRIPTLNANAEQSFSWGSSIDPVTSVYQEDKNYTSNNFSLSSGINLFNGFQNTNIIKQNKLNYEAGKYDIEKAKENISISVADAYLQILFAYEQIKNAKNQLKATEKQYSRITELFKAGGKSQYDVFQIKSQLSSEKLTLVNAENQLSIAKVNLMQLMEIPVSDNFDIEKPGFSNIFLQDSVFNTSKGIYEQALKIKPEIRSAEINTTSSEIGIKIANGAKMPNLSLNGGVVTRYSSTKNKVSYQTSSQTYEIGYLQSNPSEIVMGNVDVNTPVYKDYPFNVQIEDNFYQYLNLTLSIPVLNNKQVKTKISKAEINNQITKLEEQNIKNQLRKNIEQIFTDVKSAEKEYEASYEQLKTLKESYKNGEEKYNLGMINPVDFLLEKTKYINAENDLLKSKYNYIFKTKILDFYQGKPITL